MDHASSTGERPDKSHHEINRVICGQNTQIAHARPKWIPRRQRSTLLQVTVVRKHASLRTPARPRRIDDAGRVFALPRHQPRLALSPKFFPTGTPPQTPPPPAPPPPAQPHPRVLKTQATA